jgi:RNA polymerase sigma-70 factor (ECF subfamily)
VTQPDTATSIFEMHRPRLVRLAYRMLGSTAEAEDVVQDAWIRWQRVPLDEVREPSAFLTRTVTRLCLDVLKSARARRETYFGSWLPEPIVEEPDEEMGSDELTLTLMLAMERLSPLERAAFLLHDVFGVPLDEVANTLNRDGPAVRQLASRARKHVQEARPRFPVAREEGDRIAQAFFKATTNGDLGALRAMLAENVVMTSDGGGKAHAFPNPILGLDHVVRLYEGLYKKLTKQPAEFIRQVWIDGLPGFISRERDGTLQTTAFAVEDGRIAAIYITRNPDKLVKIVQKLSGDAGTARH